MSGFEFDEPSVPKTNAAVEVKCSTCDGDRFVLVSKRAPKASPWMMERGIEPAKDQLFEEYAACPTCNSQTDTSFWRHDGSPSKALDPARVREMMFQ